MTQHSIEGEHTGHITQYQVNTQHSTLANTEHIHTANIIQNIANIKQQTSDILLKTPDMRPDDKTRLDRAQSCSVETIPASLATLGGSMGEYAPHYSMASPPYTSSGMVS